ncbi:MAG: hypothetical protein HKN68_15525 [Saprospiraceae bacterium]|nr:hypothetical protein [Saprospiraceae bacterium]
MGELNCQDLINKEKLKYHYQSETYGYNDLEDVFRKSDEAYIQYEKFKSSNKKAKIYGLTSLGLIAAGLITVETASEDNCSSGGVCGTKIFGAMVGVIGIIPGTIGIIYKVKTGIHKRKSISIFNDQMMQEEVSMEIKISGSGIGVYISF